jgi:hypothetical protein
VSVARIKTKPETAEPARPAKSKAKKPAAEAVSAPAIVASAHPLARRRLLAIIVLGVVAMLMFGGAAIWRRVAPVVAGRERYLLPADGIMISEPPEWIVGDVRGQVIANSGLAGRLSVLDGDFLAKIENAFKLHPWIESVTRVEKTYPPAVFVDVVYRRPIAVIETPLGESKQLLPVDAVGVQLPAADVPEIRLSYLPRITGVVGQPSAGQRWDDPKVIGAVDLAVQLGAEWEMLGLKDIVPSARPMVQNDRTYFVFNLIARSGTRVIWGASPRDDIPGEDAVSIKLGRLKQCIAQYSTLDWTDWPSVIDIRRGIEITPPIAKKPKDAVKDPVVAEKPEVVAEKPTEEKEAPEDPVVAERPADSAGSDDAPMVQ